MANSKFEYVKTFEQDDRLLPQSFIVVRIDGRGFTKFAALHGWTKPHDDRACSLMNAAATALMHEQPEIVAAIGASDEYSFILPRTSDLYNRRASKLCSVFVSYFAASFVIKWPDFFPDVPLSQTPAFDARAVVYPCYRNIRDYISWRQADYHINCQYNTCFWALVGAGKTPAQAQQILKGTSSAFKNEMLFNDFNINYSKLPEIQRKGTFIYREKVSLDGEEEKEWVETKSGRFPVVRKPKSTIFTTYEDIIGDAFWEQHPHILCPKGESSE